MLQLSGYPRPCAAMEHDVLSGKVAIITGAGQGVGRGIAVAMAAAGASVVLAGRTFEKVEAVAAEITDAGGASRPIACNVKDPEDRDGLVSAALAEFGSIDILVNNAQEVVRGPLLDMADDDVERMWQSGPVATLKLMQTCHAHLADGGGVVINLGSRAGVKDDPIDCGVYAAVKEAIRSITRSAAWEWAGDGIRSYVLMPQAVTPALEQFAQNDPEAYERAMATVPMRKFGDAVTDIGPVAVFLASDDARFLTGITIPVDGGSAHLR